MRLEAIARRLDAYERLVRLGKPIGTLLLLWPTLWAVWFAARGRPEWDIVMIFALGTLLMRSAGCAVNDLADRRFDGHVARTRERPLAAGEIAPAEALGVALVLAALAFGLVLFLNRFAILLSVLAVAVACVYPFMKRFFPLPQAVLGIAFGFGIPMAYAAIRNQLPWDCWALLAANVCYSFAYDTEYAMVDRDDDVKLGLHSSAILLGRFDVAAVLAAYGAMLAILAAVGAAYRIGWPYYLGLALAAGLAAYHWRLIRHRSREGCFKAFRHSNWIGASVFAGILAAANLPR